MMGNNDENHTISFETPDMISLQKKTLESATGFTMPGSVHFGTDTDGNNTFIANAGLPGLPSLKTTHNFTTNETNTSFIVPHPLCPLYTTAIDSEGVTKSLSLGPLSVSKTEKFSDPNTLKNMNNDIISERGIRMMPDF